MRLDLTYRGRTITQADIGFIRALIARHPDASRCALSVKLCEAWNWVQANGRTRDMVARGLMLYIHRAGLIELPPKRQHPPNNAIAHCRPEPLLSAPWQPLQGNLSQVQPLSFRQVRKTPDEATFNTLIETYHYLGYARPVGEHLKYIVYAGDVPLVCMAWSSAARHIGCRDRFIGWSADVRRANLHLLAYQTRFLVLPWARVRYLASHVLGGIARRLSSDWYQLYHHPICFLETFVDPRLFRATCYRAANWIRLGTTTGRGKADRTHKANRSLKEVWGYPLSPHFRRHLGAGE